MKTFLTVILALCLLLPGWAYAQESLTEETAAPLQTPMPAEGTSEELFTIDHDHIYPKMDKSYAQGYIPTVEQGVAALVLPLCAAETLVEDQLTATLDLGESSTSPFVFGNYSKSVALQSHDTQDGTGECYLVYFEIPLEKQHTMGRYPVRVLVTGTTLTGITKTQEFVIYVTVSTGTDPHATPEPQPVIQQKTPSQPKLMVRDYWLDADPVQAGTAAQLTVTVRNTSTTRNVRNIKLTVSDPQMEVIPAGTGAQHFDTLKKGETLEWTVTLSVVPDAAPQPHALTLRMEYEDADSTPFSTEDTLIIPVLQPIRLEYESPSFPERVRQGDTATLTVPLMNLGKNTIYNVLVKAEVPGMQSGGSVLVGTLEMGKARLRRSICW